jgi:hypothetical protein
MVPIIKRTVYLMLENGEIDQKLSQQFDEKDGILNIEILTGLQSLSRESDITKLLQMGEMVRNLPPEAAASFKWEEYARSLITSLGFDPQNWVRSREEIAAEQQALAAQQQKMEMQKIFAQNAAGAMGAAAQQDIMATGGQNIPPEMAEQAMQMLQGGMSGQ